MTFNDRLNLSHAVKTIMRAMLGAMPLLLLSPLNSRAQAWNWTFEDVDSSGNYTSLALDAEGNVHMGYAVEEEGGAFRYAFRSATDSKWFKMTLEKQLGIAPTAITVDSQGSPHICYTPAGRLRYAHFDGRDWHFQAIAPNSGSIQFTCSVVLDAKGTPHFSWYHYRTPDGTDYHHLKHAVLQDGAWLVRTIDFSGATGKWNSMILDEGGRPRIAYSDVAVGNLRFAAYDGKDWSLSVVDTPEAHPQGGWLGMGASLVRGPDHEYLISYYAARSLKFARGDGSKWSIETVDSIRWLGSWIGYRSSLALDRRGWPHIAYDDGGNLKHGYWNGTRWVIQVIVAGASDPYRHPSIAISQDDTIYVAFRDPVDGFLRVAVGHSVSTQKVAVEKKQASQH